MLPSILSFPFGRFQAIHIKVSHAYLGLDNRKGKIAGWVKYQDTRQKVWYSFIGNTYTANGAAEMIKEIVANIKTDDLEIMFRMDSGYFDEEIIETIESLGANI